MFKKEQDKWFSHIYSKSPHVERLINDLKQTVEWCEECGTRRIDTYCYNWSHDTKGRSVYGFEHLPENKGCISGVCKVCAHKIKNNYQEPDPWYRRVWDWFMGD